MKKQGLLNAEKLENRQLLSATPNDPQFSSQWGLNSISAPAAWSLSTGSKNVVVAVIDSGVDLTNQDLKNNLWNNPYANTDGYVNDTYGWNFADNNNNVQDGYGHGTHVAGILGAEGNNNTGVAGVNWNVSVMVLKFMDNNGVGYGDDVIKAIEYILMMKNTYGVNIVAVNNSWGGTTGYSSLIDAEIQKLNQSNIMFVAAAGNSANNNDVTPTYPSCYTESNVISVAALNSDNTLAGFSNYGASSVSIAAPGVSILSTYVGNSYGYMSGTSMAAPFVTGAVALLESAKPNTPVSVIKDIILSTADKLSSLAGKDVCGGKLDLGAAMAKLMGVPYAANSTPTGYLTNITVRNVSGYATDPDGGGPVSVKLMVDGNDYYYDTADSNGNFTFDTSSIGYGYHNLEVLAKDNQTNEWVSVGKGSINVPYPVMHIDKINNRGVVGWGYSSVSGDSPVIIKVTINGRTVAARLANINRPELTPILGNSHHGFNIGFNRAWLRRGNNNVKLELYDTISKQSSTMWVGIVRK